MILGERMSEVVADPESVIEGINGQLYTDCNNLRMGRPMHLGPSLYVQLYRAAKLHNFASFDVYHDHAKYQITLRAEHDGKETVRSFYEDRFYTRRISINSVIEAFVKETMGQDFSYVS